MSLPFTLQPTEQPVLTLRRHWLHLYPRLVFLLLVAVTPGLALWGLAGMLPEAAWLGHPVAVGSVAVWALAWLVRAYFLWYRYQHDIWVVTTQRIVDSLKRHWFHHAMSSADLIDIQDVSISREGFFRTMFDFGDVRVQTAAEQEHFVLSAIPHPGQVLTAIDAERDRARRA